MPFEKGKSGNPNGKPKGAVNKTTAIAQSLLEGEAETLVGKVVQLALDGDLTCLRMCLERLVPIRRDTPVRIDIPEIATVAEMPKLFSAIAARLREGTTHSEATAFVGLAEAFRKSLEVVDLETRISALEEKDAQSRMA